MNHTLEDLVNIFVETCEQVEDIMQIDMEIYETPTDDVCMALFVLGRGATGVCVGTGMDDDNYLVVGWENHFKVIKMFKERMQITEQDEEEEFFNVTY
jgi:hypothetical protein